MKKKRLRELDFLRGLAILLVLFRHTDLHPFLKNMGWIGVDLFFVLSGYLVSNLLFKEYQKFGKIQPIRFLIRRGFKIYPLYYLTLLLYLIPRWGNLDLKLVIGDLTFLQNYFNGWGYLYDASWSLAIEEHFYFGLALLFWLGLRSKILPAILDSSSLKFEIICAALFLFCLSMRIHFTHNFPELNTQNFTYTHLRIDSLLAGVLLAYWINFKGKSVQNYFKKHKLHFTLLILGLLIWTPFVEPLESLFARTLGFSFVFIAFTLLIGIFLMDDKINPFLDKVFTKRIVDLMTKVGFSSYAIYIIHTFVNMSVLKLQRMLGLGQNDFLYFLITSIISITLGILITRYGEGYFLQIRNRYFPSKIGSVTMQIN